MLIDNMMMSNEGWIGTEYEKDDDKGVEDKKTRIAVRKSIRLAIMEKSQKKSNAVEPMRDPK